MIFILFKESISASTSNSNLTEQNGDDTDNEKDDYLQTPELVNKEKHVFILSSAGKPIYSRQVFKSHYYLSVIRSVR